MTETQIAHPELAEHTEDAPQAPRPSTLADIISTNVRALRRRRRWSAEQAGQEWENLTGRSMSAQVWYSLERSGGRAWTAADIEAAAVLFGIEPGALLVPLPACVQCDGRPPVGFICAECGAEGPRKA
ncbi:hypothetical protein ACH4PU_14730 [Streptomyces sp. NPDC021100]|uniref:hypothetical protein n=1 Tax=Streptomyces sp. NPDC021100 TaxID=3365114 RepID=UPI003788BF8A